MTAPSVYDHFTFYLRAEDLQGKAHAVTIASVIVEDVFNPRAKKPMPALVLTFVKGRRHFKLNKTQAAALMALAGTDDYTRFVGMTVLLTPAPAQNGRDTIVVSAAAVSQQPDQEEPQRTTAESIRQLGFRD